MIIAIRALQEHVREMRAGFSASALLTSGVRSLFVFGK